MAEEDREAFEKFARTIRLAYNPVGALELQIAQSIADDEWRLSRARAIENNVIALGHSNIAGEVETNQHSNACGDDAGKSLLEEP